MNRRSEQIVPTTWDILAGRGRGKFQSGGNRRFLSIIAAYKAQYRKAHNNDKQIITRMVYSIVTEPINGVRPRFLKPQKQSQWIEMTEQQARAKIAHTLRERKDIKSTDDPSVGSVCKSPPVVVTPVSSPDPYDKANNTHNLDSFRFDLGNWLDPDEDGNVHLQ